MTNPKYEIVDYKESWQQEFEQIARQLREGLGDLALRNVFSPTCQSTSYPHACTRTRTR